MQLYAAGSRFKIYLCQEENQSCPTLDFLEALAQGGKREQGDAATLDRRLRYFAEHGPPTGEERCRYFAGEKVFELKAPGGARLIGFYHPTEHAVVVCSHGCRRATGAIVRKLNALRLFVIGCVLPRPDAWQHSMTNYPIKG